MYPTAKTLNSPGNSHARDRRHSFGIGRLVVGDDVWVRMDALLGDESRFKLGELVHKHVSGLHGDVTAADAALNEFALRQHADGGSQHVVASKYAVGNLNIEIVTHLANGETVVRLA